MTSVTILFLLSLAVLTLSAPTAHVVFIIGQSNSVGQTPDGHTDEDITYPNILQTSCCVNGAANNNQCKLISGQDPLHHQCDLGYLNSSNLGFGMSFARELHSDVPEDDLIVLVPAGIGGTGFNDNVWTAYNGTGFVQALTRLRNTFTLLADNYPDHTASLNGILWHQGENEAGQNTSTVDYLSKDIIPMINAWRDSKLLPQTSEKVPFVVGNLVPGWVLDPNQPERLGVFVALQILDQYVPYSMSTPSQGLVGDIHFTGKSQRLFGKRYYAAWKLAQLNSVVA